MRTILFTGSKRLYEDSGKGDIYAIYVPLKARQQVFPDLINPTGAQVRARYSGVKEAPMWRASSRATTVYGTLPVDIQEMRAGIDVYLPQDLVPHDTPVFYFVFGDRWVVHGERRFTEDGLPDWATSLVDGKVEDPIDVIVTSLSERMMSGVMERICVAVHGESDFYDKLQTALEPFDVQVQRFGSLKAEKSIKPLYAHRDHGLFMLTAAMFAFLVLSAAVGYVVLNYIEVGRLDKEIVQLRDEIRKVQMNKKLGSITNPQDVLKFMQGPMKQPPSSVLHAASDAANFFGSIKYIVLGDDGKTGVSKPRRTDETVYIGASVEAVTEDLLLDQERVAKSALITRPWIRSIERQSQTGKNMALKIGVQVE